MKFFSWRLNAAPALQLGALAAFLISGCTSQTGAAPETPTPTTALTAVAAPTQTTTAAPQNATPRRLSWRVVRSFPHDPRAFTQGLLWHEGALLESTGLVGQSSLRRVELESGRVLQRVNVPSPVFAEGLALANGKLYQLSWQNRVGFTYDPRTLERLGQFSYQNEGWGLTFDGESLIQSDGTDVLTFRAPQGFAPQKTVRVTRAGAPLASLNELEFIGGRVWANVWTTDLIVLVNPQNGRVEAELDLSALRREIPGFGQDGENVLNGIAYDPARKRLFVTGKNWPKLFEIEVEEWKDGAGAS